MNRRIESGGKSRICDALCQLGKDRPIERVTVQEIIALAGMNRSTFYYHFDGVSAVLEWMISEFLKEYLQLLFDIPKGDNDVLLDSDILFEQEESICALIQRRKNYLELFFSQYNERHFRERFWDEYKKYASVYDLAVIHSRKDIRTIKRGIVYDYCLRVNFAIWFELLSYWHDRKFHETSRDFLEVFDVLFGGVIGFENNRS